MGFASENPLKPIWRDNAWFRHMRPRLDPIGLTWANFQVLRRTYASLGHDGQSRVRTGDVPAWDSSNQVGLPCVEPSPSQDFDKLGRGSNFNFSN